MIKLLLMLLPFSVLAVEINPAVNTTITLNCDAPAKYIDNSDINDQITILFYESINKVNWKPIPQSELCANEFIYTHGLVDGDTRYYAVKAAVKGIESELSNIEVVTAVIPKQPKPPTLRLEF